MKKIIAAALSVLVGAFGYTIVDSTIENRVSRLESEVYELREEISNQHLNYQITDGCGLIHVDKQLVKSENFRSKFLVRIHNSGYVEYVSPQNYTPRDGLVAYAAVEPTTEIDLNEPRTEISIEDPRETTIVLDDPRDTTISNSDFYDESSEFHQETTGLDSDLEDPRDQSTTAYYFSGAPGDYYFNVTDCSSVIAQIDKNIEYQYQYNNDYSLVSYPFDNSKVYIKFSCSGHTDNIFAGHNIKITPDFLYGSNPYGLDSIYNSKLISITKSEIASDGTFEYVAIYEIQLASDYSEHLHFTINNITLFASS